MFKRTWLILILAGPIAMACLPPDDGTSTGSGGGADGDGDGDGFTVEAGDCDDQRADVHPGAEEICDQVDNDCNGRTDEGMVTLAQTSAGSLTLPFIGGSWPIEPTRLSGCNQGPGSCGVPHAHLSIVVKKGVTQVVREADSGRFTLNYGLLTPEGDLQTIHSGSGAKYHLEADELGRPTTIRFEDSGAGTENHTLTLTRDDAGRVTEIQKTESGGSFVWKQFSYDEQGRLQQVRPYSMDGAGDVSPGQGADYVYSTNDTGPVTDEQQIRSDGSLGLSRCYQFDQQHRLVERFERSCDERSEVPPNLVESLTESLTYDNSGQVIEDHDFTFQYDQNGNIIKLLNAQGRETNFRFACAGQPSVLDEATPHNPLEE